MRYAPFSAYISSTVSKIYISILEIGIMNTTLHIYKDLFLKKSVRMVELKLTSIYRNVLL